MFSTLTRPAAPALAAFAAAALAFAFILEYGFGFEPCNLCIWERWPWVAVVIACAGGMLFRRPQLGLCIAALALLANVGLATYHFGIEQGVFALPESCTAGEAATSIEALKAQLMAARPTCDQVSAAFLGLSLTAWNGIASLLAAIVALGVVVRDYRVSNS